MLYLVATPIGNLGDITFRAIEVLKACDLVLCEDTRRTKVLLERYEINKPMRSYEKFSEAKREEPIIDELLAGKTFCLVSDAGTPGIADPGQRLVKRCHDEGINVCVIPGPCALISGLTLSGFDSEHFQFIGFLPKKGLDDTLMRALEFPGSTVCYESPHRIEKTLHRLAELAPERRLGLARELTKIHEECLIGTAQELLKKSIRGEIVLVIEAKAEFPLSPEETVEYLQKCYSLSVKEAIKLAASIGGFSRNTLYKKFKT